MRKITLIIALAMMVSCKKDNPQPEQCNCGLKETFKSE